MFKKLKDRVSDYIDPMSIGMGASVWLIGGIVVVEAALTSVGAFLIAATVMTAISAGGVMFIGSLSDKNTARKYNEEKAKLAHTKDIKPVQESHSKLNRSITAVFKPLGNKIKNSAGNLHLRRQKQPQTNNIAP